MITEDYLKNKTILLAVPNDFGLPQMFKKNLEYLGMKVYLLEHSKNHEKISFADEIKHIKNKILRGDRSYKNLAKDKNRLETEEQLHSKMLDSLSEKTDFALILRPDLLNNVTVEKIKTKTAKMVGYQWDGFERYPNILEKVKLFDYFFVFDKKDLNADKKLKLITNFYFDFNLKDNKTPTIDVFFIGSHIESRMPKLIEISSYLKNKGLLIDINVIGTSKKNIKRNGNTGITHIEKIFDFEENYNRIKNSKVILDLLNNIHNGLSLRTFEAVGLQKKLITDNSEIKNFDFYHPDNIFILGERSIDEIEEFISAPYKILDIGIYKKYGFQNWICNVLEIPGYLPIISN